MRKLNHLQKIVMGVVLGSFLSTPSFSSRIAPLGAEAKLQDMDLTLPTPAQPVANYVSVRPTKDGKILYVSGQLPVVEGVVQHPGKLGKSVSDADGVKAAEICALNILAQVKTVVGSLDRVRCLKLTGLVNSIEAYTQHPKIINGASDLIGKVLEENENGKHARAAFGVASLPMGACVEIEAIFEVLED